MDALRAESIIFRVKTLRWATLTKYLNTKKYPPLKLSIAYVMVFYLFHTLILISLAIIDVV